MKKQTLSLALISSALMVMGTGMAQAADGGMSGRDRGTAAYAPNRSDRESGADRWEARREARRETTGSLALRAPDTSQAAPVTPTPAPRPASERRGKNG